MKLILDSSVVLRILRYLYDKGIITKDDLIKSLEKLCNLGFRVSSSIIEKVIWDL